MADQPYLKWPLSRRSSLAAIRGSVTRYKAPHWQTRWGLAAPRIDARRRGAVATEASHFIAIGASTAEALRRRTDPRTRRAKARACRDFHDAFPQDISGYGQLGTHDDQAEASPDSKPFAKMEVSATTWTMAEEDMPPWSLMEYRIIQSTVRKPLGV